jgi:hypothetical protein
VYYTSVFSSVSSCRCKDCTAAVRLFITVLSLRIQSLVTGFARAPNELRTLLSSTCTSRFSSKVLYFFWKRFDQGKVVFQKTPYNSIGIPSPFLAFFHLEPQRIYKVVEYVVYSGPLHDVSAAALRMGPGTQCTRMH